MIDWFAINFNVQADRATAALLLTAALGRATPEMQSEYQFPVSVTYVNNQEKSLSCVFLGIYGAIAGVVLDMHAWFSAWIKCFDSMSV